MLGWVVIKGWRVVTKRKLACVFVLQTEKTGGGSEQRDEEGLFSRPGRIAGWGREQKGRKIRKTSVQ
jgi:hypothetical protein